MRTVRATKSELAAFIVAELKPLRALPHGEIDKRVRETLDASSRLLLARITRSAIHKNNDHIEILRGTIRRLVNQISKAPAPVRLSAFSGTQLRAVSGKKPSVIRVSSSERVFLAELKEVGQRLLAAKISARRDPIKQACAALARAFFLEYSEKVPSSSANSPFRVVASLVYEYFTGRAEQDLERSCEGALRQIRNHPVYVGKKHGLPRSAVKMAKPKAARE